MKKTTYKQLLTSTKEALRPLRELYPYSCEAFVDGYFMGSYELHETLRHVGDEKFPELNKPEIKDFVELYNQFDKLREPSVPAKVFLFGATIEEVALKYEKDLNTFYRVAIPALEKLLAATPSFVSAMYAYRNMPTPAST